MVHNSSLKWIKNSAVRSPENNKCGRVTLRHVCCNIQREQSDILFCRKSGNGKYVVIHRPKLYGAQETTQVPFRMVLPHALLQVHLVMELPTNHSVGPCTSVRRGRSFYLFPNSPEPLSTFEGCLTVHLHHEIK